MNAESFMELEPQIGAQLSKQPIAIVGVSSVFPAASDVRTFWGNVVSGKSAITDVPQTHWSLEDYYDPDPTVADKTYCNKGGFIPKTPFSPIEFGLPPAVLEVTDILQLLSLNVARDLFVDSGYDKRHFDRDRTGVVLGITGANSLTQPLTSRLQGPVWRKVLASRGVPEAVIDDALAAISHAYAPWAENSFPGMLGNVVAGRVANRFDLGGINCTIDAACASSLAAMRMAIDELTLGRADMMITGGCDAENTILMYMCFSKTPAFSRSGIIRPFDVDSDGTLIGEGIGMLMLKRLADAERDQDRIYAVIKGLGASSDGRFKSIYAPRAEGQVKALRRAYEDASCVPDSIGLLEAHGTGTAVGDATEISGLKQLMSESAAGHAHERHIALGTVKSQIGHTKAAAGAASAIKTALALHHKILPPSINVKMPNPALGLESSPFYVNTKSRPWFLNYGATKRRAGISSFGFGGTNFHMVLEEYQQAHEQPYRLHTVAQPVVIGAADPASLLARIESLAAALPNGTDWAIRDAELPTDHCRIAFAAGDAEECAEKLAIAKTWLAGIGDVPESRHPKGLVYRLRALVRSAEDGKLAGLFAGQGAQHLEMGLELALTNDLLLKLVGYADSHFEAAGLEPLSSRMYAAPAFDPASLQAQELALRETRYAQPAIGTLAMAQLALLRHAGLQLDMVGGHSFGELAAVWAAGAIDDSDFIGLAVARGAAMAPPEDDAFDPGTMTAVNGSRKAVQAALDASGITDVRLCNLNTNDQQVVGGTTAGIERFEQILAGAGLKFTRLPVSGAFHTPLVAHASSLFARSIAGTTFSTPTIPVYRNRNGEPYPEDPAAIAEGLARQLLEPVQFKAMIEAMYRDGARIFVEFGPRNRLTAMVDSVLADRPHLALALDRGMPSSSFRQIAEVVAELAAAGVPLGDIDPFGYPALPPRAPGKAAVDLLGINYVSPVREAAFAEALAHPSVVCGALATAPGVETGPAAPIREERGDMTYHDTLPQPETPHRPEREPLELLCLIGQRNADLHAQFLKNQRDTVQEVIAAMARVQELDAQALADRPGLMDGLREMIQMIESGHRMASELHRSYITAAEQLSHMALAFSDQKRDPSGNHADLRKLAGVPRQAEIDTLPAEIGNQSKAVTSLGTGLPPAMPSAPPVAEMPKSVLAKPGKSLTSGGLLGSGGPVAAPAIDRPVKAPAAAPSPAPVTKPAPAMQAATPVVAAAPVAEAPAADIVRSAPAELPTSAVAAPASIDSDMAAKIEAELVAIVADKTGYPADVLDLDMDMEADLGIDSIKRVEIMGTMLETHPDIEAPEPQAMGQLRTLREVTTFMANAIAGGASRPFDNAGRHAAAPAAADETRCTMAGIGRAEIQLCEQPAMLKLDAAFRPGARILVSAPAGAFREALINRLSGQGLAAVILDWTDGPEEDLKNTLAAQQIDGLLHLDPAGFGGNETDYAVLRRLLLLAKHLKRPLNDAEHDGRTVFMTVTAMDGGLGIAGGEGAPNPAGLAAMSVSGLVKTLAVEASRIFCRQLDVQPGLDTETVISAIADELVDADQKTIEIGLDAAGRRLALNLRPAFGRNEMAVSDLAGKLHIVTGGARGITASCIERLAAAGGRRFLLIGRSPFVTEPQWARGIADDDLKKAAAAELRARQERPVPRVIAQMADAVTAGREIALTLGALAAHGAQAEYLSLDIADRDAVAQMLAHRPEIASAAPGSLAVIHGAGVLADGFIEAKKPEELERVFKVKVDGLRSLLAALPAEAVGRLMLFSSAAGLFGNAGQVDYAMANEALNRLANDWRRRHPECAVVSINWGAWDAGMVSPQIKEVFAERGIPLIPIELGAAMFADEVAKPAPANALVLIGGLAPLSEQQTPDLLLQPGTRRRLNLAIDHVLSSPLLRDHAIDGVAVLPAAFALGLAIRAAEVLMPGHEVARIGRFRVLKGVTGIEQLQTLNLSLRIETVGDQAVQLRVDMTDHAGRPRYAVDDVQLITRVPRPLASGQSDAHHNGGMMPVDQYYTDGTLFHGPAMRLLAGISADGAGWRFTAIDSGPGHEPTIAVARGRRYCPLVVDALLQAALVVTRKESGVASLPAAMHDVHCDWRSSGGFVVRAHRLEDKPTQSSHAVEARQGNQSIALQSLVVKRAAAVSPQPA